MEQIADIISASNQGVSRLIYLLYILLGYHDSLDLTWCVVKELWDDKYESDHIAIFQYRRQKKRFPKLILSMRLPLSKMANLPFDSRSQ